MEDYITEENPVRFIDAFVESLDLVELGFVRSTPADTGRPAYDPAALLRLYVYGYLNRVCREFTLLCKKLALFDGELVAIDGSKFKAVNNRKRNFSDIRLNKAISAIDDKIGAYLANLDEQDRTEAAYLGQQKARALHQRRFQL